MQLVQKILFAFSILVSSWLLMQVIHEFGHILGAWLTGGTIERVVLKPLTISRTDVSPNPNPAFVVWLGPIVGCLLPIIFLRLAPSKHSLLKRVSKFFAGFCLIANGAYISVGAFDGIGDCGEMLRTGTPMWIMIVFGVIAIPTGLLLWHSLGSPMDYLSTSHKVSITSTLLALSLVLSVVLIESLYGVS